MGLDETQRGEVFYTGMVQGVGFRYHTLRIAHRFAVTGFVRNLRDGRVQIVAEGRATELVKLFDAVDAELGCYISRKEQTTHPATGEYSVFDIRY